MKKFIKWTLLSLWAIVILTIGFTLAMELVFNIPTIYNAINVETN